MKKYVPLFLVLALAATILAGCGETFSGIGKDARRIGKGIKTIAVREE